jgi:hypothetical protein
VIPLLANAGTPLMWLTFGHMTVGNALVAVGEAALLHLVWRVPLRRAFAWMVVANYLSLALGWVVFSFAHDAVPWSFATPHDLLPILGAAVLLAFGVTIVAEWPLVARALDARFRPTLRALRASVIVQVASYAVLIPLYANASSLAAVTTTTAADAATVAGPLVGRAFYIDPDGTVRSVSLDGTGDRTEAPDVDGSDSWIAVEPRSNRLRLWDGERHQTTWSYVVEGRTAKGPRYGFGPAADLSAADRWTVRAGFWPVEGLSVHDERDGTRYRLGFETPFVSLSSRSPTLLPGGRVVYSLGRHVVLLDLETRRLATLAQGHGPAVVLAETP